MIVKIFKYLIFGPKKEMDRFFELAQRAGFLEFIGVAHKKALELPDEIKVILEAIKIARHHEIHPLASPPVPSEPVALAKKLVELNTMHEQFLEEKRLLHAEIARIAPFGNFSKDDLVVIEKDGKRVMQFFCMKSDLAREITLPPEVIFVGTDYDLDYFVSLNKEKAQYPKMIEILIDRPVGELTERGVVIDERIAALESDIRHYSNAMPILQSGLVDLLNDFHLRLAKYDASGPLDSSLFAIEAWIPKTKIKAFMGLLSNLDVCAEQIAIEPKDKIPTCMENKGIAKVGEDIVNVYDTPSANDKDPSLWVLTSFSLFFAMIIADAGYGLLYLLLGLYLLFKFPNVTGAGKRFFKLILILSTACIIWGACTVSFFGVEIGPNNPLRKVSFIHILAAKKAEYHMEQKDDVYEEYIREYPAVATATDGHDFLIKASKVVDGKVVYEALTNFYDNILMEISLIIGVIHLSLSFIRYMTRNWAGIGWISFMVGGYLFFPKILNATTMLNFTGLLSKPICYSVGEWMVYAGVGAAFVASFIAKGWGRFHEIMNAVGVFSDGVSYLRLYALALASSVIANTFNSLGLEAGLFGGIFIILIGHICNIVLSIMGGVIHGLRLNFIEWYHYSFEGDGRLFNPLRLRKTK
jgi:V/A-type H+-transporting ATPase subunit I